jgi:hypothetical protein
MRRKPIRKIFTLLAGALAAMGLALGLPGVWGPQSAKASCTNSVSSDADPGDLETPQCGGDSVDGPPTMIEDAGATWDASCTGWRFRNTWRLYRGTWPQNHDVFLHTTWCGTGTGGRITYQSSYTTTGQYFCNPSLPYATRIDGGPGFTTVTVEGGAYFACPSGIPWIQLHYHPWLQVRYYPGGGSNYVAYGG